jgi:hypothetical protein
VTAGLESPPTICCSYCGKPAWVPFHHVVDDEGEFEEVFADGGPFDRQRRPLSLSPDGPLCKRCWAHEWYVTGQTYVKTLKSEAPGSFLTDARGSFLLNHFAPLGNPEDETEQEQPPRARFIEFMCVVCMQMRPIHQRPNDDDNRCADCFDGGPLPDWLELSKCSEPPRRWWHCEWCRSAHLAALICDLKFTGLESKRFYQVDRLVSVTRLPKSARRHWADLRWQWSALCPLCGLERRNEAWVLREHAHRKCWDEQKRRERRKANLAIKSRSEPTNPRPVVQLWDNGIRGKNRASQPLTAPLRSLFLFRLVLKRLAH